MIASPTSRTCATNSSVVELDAEAGDRLELVERAAGVAEPAAAHLPERHAARGDDRRRRRATSCRRRRRSSACRRPCARARRARSIVSPLRTIASVSANVSAASRARGSRRPCRTRPSGSRAPRRARSRARARAISSARSSPPSRLRSISSAGRISLARRSSGPGIPRRGRLAAEPRVHRRADVARTRPRGCARPRSGPATYASSSAYSREWSVDGVVGSQPWSEVRTSRSPWPQRVEQVGQPAVEVLEAAVEVLGVVAVAPEHVRLDEVREHEARRRCSRSSCSVSLIPSTFDFVGCDSSMSEAGEDVGDLPDAVHLAPRRRGRSER